jgi:hypothetical protein
MSFLDLKDVIRLLRSEVERAGGQAAWAKKTGCVYRKPKPGHSGDEALQGSGVNL